MCPLGLHWFNEPFNGRELSHVSSAGTAFLFRRAAETRCRDLPVPRSRKNTARDTPFRNGAPTSAFRSSHYSRTDNSWSVDPSTRFLFPYSLSVFSLALRVSSSLHQMGFHHPRAIIRTPHEASAEKKKLRHSP